MTDKDVLTQDEIDALLAGVDDGSLAEGEGDGPDEASISTYDLARAERGARGRLPAVELISEKFARKLRGSLPASLKIPIEIGTGGVQVVRFSEYVEGLYVPTCIKLLRMAPLAGLSMLALDAKLVHAIVDRFFGGKGGSLEFATREFSSTELRVIERIVKIILGDFSRAWEDTLPVTCEVVGHEVNPGLVNFIDADEFVLVTSFRFELDGHNGELQIAIPYEALEPFKRNLDSTPRQEGSEAQDRWRVAMRGNLLDTKVSLRCVIGQSEVRLKDLLRLKPGDVLDVDMEDLHRVMIERRHVFSATLGDSRGRFALEFEGFEQGA